MSETVSILDEIDPTASLPTQERAREYAALAIRQRDIETELDHIKARKRILENRLMEEWTEQGISNMRVDGVTLYIHAIDWAGALEGQGDVLLETLRANGNGWMIKTGVNQQTLSAWVREQKKEGLPIPDCIEVKTKYSLRARSR